MGLIRSVLAPPRPEGLPECAYFNPWLGEGGKWVRCRKRSCPECGKSWVAMHKSKMSLNLGALGGPVVLITITPPGKDRLPYACDRNHDHARYGCQVDKPYADSWAAIAPEQWKRLRDAARKAVKAAGLPHAALVLERVWEPQKRGVPHLHVVAGARTPEEAAAAELFHQELLERAVEYGFGEQLHITKPMSGGEAARYLAGYLLGRSKKKGSIRDNLAHPRMPRSLIWETPAIGSLSKGERMVAWRERLGLREGTGVTIRRLRYARWYLAALARHATTYPHLPNDELFAVAKVAMLLERGNAPPEQRFRGHVKTLMLMRVLAEAA